jgi:hypothetical protein
VTDNCFRDQKSFFKEFLENSMDLAFLGFVKKLLVDHILQKEAEATNIITKDTTEEVSP